MKTYALKNISQIKFINGNVEIKYDDGAVFKLKEIVFLTLTIKTLKITLKLTIVFRTKP